jgi:hypothetical protein
MGLAFAALMVGTIELLVLILFLLSTQVTFGINSVRLTPKFLAARGDFRGSTPLIPAPTQWHALGEGQGGGFRPQVDVRLVPIP